MGGSPGLQKHHYPWWGVDPVTQEKASDFRMNGNNTGGQVLM